MWATVASNQTKTQAKIPDKKPWKDGIDDYLKCFKCMGVEIVRWVLLGDCYNYGSAKWVADPHDWTVEDKWQLANGFEDDFVELLRMLPPGMKLLPVLVLHSAFWPGIAVPVFKVDEKQLRSQYPYLRRGQVPGGPRGLSQTTKPESPPDWINRLKTNHTTQVSNAAKPGTHKGGRAEILAKKRTAAPADQGGKQDYWRRKLFLENTLGKLLGKCKSAGVADRIYAWELVNEPEGITDRIYYDNFDAIYNHEPDGFIRTQRDAPASQDNWSPPFNHDDIRNYIIDAAKLCKRYEVNWTVGFQYYDSMVSSLPDNTAGGDWVLHDGRDKDHLEKYLPQFHYYGGANPMEFGKKPSERPFPRRPKTKSSVLLGEFPLADPNGTAGDPVWYNPDDKKEKRTLAERLELIKSQFDVALGWSARGREPEVGGDPRSAWSQAICETIATSNKGKPSTCADCQATLQGGGQTQSLPAGSQLSNRPVLGGLLNGQREAIGST